MPSIFKHVRKPAEPQTPTNNQPNMVLVEEAPVPRRPYGFKDAVVGHRGLVYTPSGVFTHQMELPLSSPAVVEERAEVDPRPILEDHPEEDNHEDQTAKKQRQWRRWSEEVIPALIKPYLSLLQESGGLRDMNMVRGMDLCKGCDKGHIIEVSCIFFERKSLLSPEHFPL